MVYIYWSLATLLGLYVIGTLVYVRLSESDTVEATPDSIPVKDVPSILNRLETGSSEGQFAAFVFEAANEIEKETTVNLQFSIEEGQVGLDWVLLAPQNVRDEQEFTQFSRSQGYRIEKKEANEVSYLRVEQGDLAKLCIGVMQELYGLRWTDEVELIEGQGDPLPNAT